MAEYCTVESGFEAVLCGRVQCGVVQGFAVHGVLFGG